MVFWKKSLISDHGLLKRTIVGTLHNPNPPSCRVKTSKFVRLATCKIHFCTNLHLNNNFLSVKWGSWISNFVPKMSHLHQGTFIYAFGIIKNRLRTQSRFWSSFMRKRKPLKTTCMLICNLGPGSYNKIPLPLLRSSIDHILILPQRNVLYL